MAQVETLRLPANGFDFSGFSVGPATGRTVLLLHGFPQTSQSWREVATRLADQGLRAVAIDQRGYSPGARPSSVAEYTAGDLTLTRPSMAGQSFSKALTSANALAASRRLTAVRALSS